MSKEPEFFEPLKRMDPEFAESLSEAFFKVNEEGALSPKVKSLISLALDASEGHEEGVLSLAEKAREQGATEEEILETVETATVNSGIQALAMGVNAFRELEER